MTPTPTPLASALMLLLAPPPHELESWVVGIIVIAGSLRQASAEAVQERGWRWCLLPLLLRPPAPSERRHLSKVVFHGLGRSFPRNSSWRTLLGGGGGSGLG